MLLGYVISYVTVLFMVYQAVDKQMMTALHMAASHNENEICRMLIEAGANLRCCDEEECTPLHYACMEGSLRVSQMLFEAGEKQDGWVTVSQVNWTSHWLTGHCHR